MELRAGPDDRWRPNRDIADSGVAVLPAIEVSNVWQTYVGPGGQSIEALAGVSFDARPGEFVAIVGPSGSGKTTLLNVVAGLVLPTGGEALVGGRPPLETVSAHRASFVFQDATLLPWRTVAENTRLPIELAGHKCGHADIRRLLSLVGLSEFEHLLPHQLSGGMRSRAALARALVTNPALLLLDEPFGALDELTALQLNLELAAMWERHRATVLLVTHSLRQAVLLSDRILVLSPRPGRVVLEVEVGLPRPRTAAQLESSLAIQIEAKLRRALLEMST